MFYPFPFKDGDGNIFYATLGIRFVELNLPWGHALHIGPFAVDVDVAADDDDEEVHYFTSSSCSSCSQGREESRFGSGRRRDDDEDGVWMFENASTAKLFVEHVK
mmetsp:Transcript_30806/g.48297  ORF Transcript_30806/g.48297 Transcript_30806/m.48297 type:complete len:105 (+) Transcript_30806:217-531(+)